MLPVAFVVLGSMLALGQAWPVGWWDQLGQPGFQPQGLAAPTTQESWRKARGQLETEMGKLQSQLQTGVERTNAMAQTFNGQFFSIKRWEDEAGSNLTAMMEAMQAMGERLAKAEDGVREVNLLRHSFLTTRREQNLSLVRVQQSLQDRMSDLETANQEAADQVKSLKKLVDSQADVIKQQGEALRSLDSLRYTVAAIKAELQALKAGH